MVTWKRVVLMAAIVSMPVAAGAGEKLAIASWGGAYAQSQSKAFFDPFRNTGVDVTITDYQDEPAAIGTALASRGAAPDVIEIDTQTALMACSEGLLEKIDWKKLGLEREKFTGASQQNCAVPSIVFGTVLAYDASKFKPGPMRTADLFDLKAFPGKRALRKSPLVNLEWALIADGVSQADVYKVLRTKAGIDRAFKKLDTIKDQIVWWTDGAEPAKLLGTGAAAMASAWNGRITVAVQKDKKPFAIVWDNEGLDWVCWAIVKGSPNKDTGYRFIAFASDPGRLAGLAGDIAYGPANKDAGAKIGNSALADLPTAPANMKTALIVDAKFWAANGDVLNERFKAWLGK